MPDLYVGTTPVSNLRLGSTQVSKAYLGTTEVWAIGQEWTGSAAAIALTVRSSTWGPALVPSGRTAHYDASHEASFTYYTDTTHVARWEDLSGNDWYLETQEASQAPNRVVGYNGVPVLEFQGYDWMVHWINSTTPEEIDLAQPITVQIVAAATVIPPYPAGLIGGSGGGTEPGFRIDVQTATEILFAAGNFVNKPYNSDQHLITAVFNGASSQQRIDGVQVGTDNPGSNQLTRMQIGLTHTQSEMTICEIVFYNRVLTAPEIAYNESLLQAKWFKPAGVWTGSPASITLTAAARTWYTGAAPPFRPDYIEDCLGWWDASDASTFTYSSGTSVSQWRDKSALARHLTAPSSGDEPDRTGVMNSLTTVEFDGAAYMLISGYVPPSQPYTVFWVGSVEDVAVGREYYGLFAGEMLGVDIQVARRLIDQRLYFDAGAPAHYALDTNPHVIGAVFDGRRSRQRIDATQVGAAHTGVSNLSRLRIGAGAFHDFKMVGQIGEVCWYNRNLTATEIDEIESYLMGKWFAPPSPQTWTGSASALTHTATSGTWEVEEPPPTGFEDDFERANGLVGNGWLVGASSGTGPTIVSGVVQKGDGATFYENMVWPEQLPGDDIWVEVDVDDAQNYFMVQIHSDGLDVATEAHENHGYNFRWQPRAVDDGGRVTMLKDGAYRGPSNMSPTGWTGARTIRFEWDPDAAACTVSVDGVQTVVRTDLDAEETRLGGPTRRYVGVQFYDVGATAAKFRAIRAGVVGPVGPSAQVWTGSAGALALTVTSSTWRATQFPVIAGTPVTEVGTSMGAQVISAPTGIVAGELLLAFAAHDNSGTAMTASAGWTVVRETANAAAVRIGVFARIATATGADALTVTGTTQDYCASMMRIANHGVTAIATDIQSAIANAATGNADPPSLDAGSVKEWRWIAAAAVDLTTAQTITAMPSGYTQAHAALASASSTSSVALGVASRAAEAQTENPGTFTNPTQEWAAVTLAIPPLTAVAQTWTGSSSAVSLTVTSGTWSVASVGGGGGWTEDFSAFTEANYEIFRLYSVTPGYGIVGGVFTADPIWQPEIFLNVADATTADQYVKVRVLNTSASFGLAVCMESPPTLEDGYFIKWQPVGGASVQLFKDNSFVAGIDLTGAPVTGDHVHELRVVGGVVTYHIDAASWELHTSTPLALTGRTQQAFVHLDDGGDGTAAQFTDAEGGDYS